VLPYERLNCGSALLGTFWIVRFSHSLLLLLQSCSQTRIVVLLVFLLSLQEGLPSFPELGKNLILLPKGIIIAFLQTCPLKCFAEGLVAGAVILCV
jgi:hypothetical protein